MKTRLFQGMSLFGLITVATLFSISISMAAGAETLENGKKRGPQHLIKVLSVDENQQESFLEIMKQQHEKRMNIHELYSDSRKEEHASMKLLHEETQALLQGILTPEQLEKFSKMLKRRGHKGPRSPARPPVN